MNTEHKTELLSRFPELFSDTTQFDDVGDGWFLILFALSDALTYKYKQLKRTATTSNESPQWPQYVQKWIAATPPRYLQIKEKFGSLRVYVDKHSSETDAVIRFAEIMSGSTCEYCGNIGTKRTDGWVKTRCDSCHQKHLDGQDLR